MFEKSDSGLYVPQKNDSASRVDRLYHDLAESVIRHNSTNTEVLVAVMMVLRDARDDCPSDDARQQFDLDMSDSLQTMKTFTDERRAKKES